MAQTPHKPEQVWYCEDLRGDLSRRDFTVNAMALDKLGNVYDYHGGQQDLEEQVLRTVGDAETRYREDALRMYRACRFVAQLGFDYVQNGQQKPAFGSRARPTICLAVTAFRWPAVPGYRWKGCAPNWINYC